MCKWLKWLWVSKWNFSNGKGDDQRMTGYNWGKLYKRNIRESDSRWYRDQRLLEKLMNNRSCLSPGIWNQFPDSLRQTRTSWQRRIFMLAALVANKRIHIHWIPISAVACIISVTSPTILGLYAFSPPSVLLSLRPSWYNLLVLP